MTLQPIGPYLLCKQIEEAPKSYSGIMLPHEEPKECKKVVVIAVGHVEFPHRFTENQILVVLRYSGKNIFDHDGTKYLLIDEKEVLAELTQ